jgi:hypothetical protein
VIKNQAIECAEQLSSAFYRGAADGLLGLAFDGLNSVKPNPVPTPVQNMNTEGVIPKVFVFLRTSNFRELSCLLANSLVITRHLGIIHSVCHCEMRLMPGYIDKQHIGSGEIFYTPLVDDSGYWKVSSASATVNGKVISRPNNTAVCDTGTSLCLVDSTLCQAIYGQIPGAKYALSSDPG